MSEYAIRATGVVKRYGEVVALDGLDVSVPPGKVLGVLGPNGAGKTTLVRVLSTLVTPDAGEVRVAGHDVVTDAEAVRRSIGLCGQAAAVDPMLTGRENLVMFARLFHLRAREARERAGELLARLGLEAAADRPARTYSGGMKRRLDLAAGLVTRPSVVFLDEPTTGLDPRSRIELWGIVRELVADGSTILLTTQYLEEADELADDIVIVEHGKVVAAGTPKELKSEVGGERIEVTVADRALVPAAVAALGVLDTVGVRADDDTGKLSLSVADGAPVLPDVVRLLDSDGVRVTDLSLRTPTLDEVFLALTGRKAEGKDPVPARPGGGMGRGRR
ncbi:ATP-binding cassette domain-containing protein [Amycolatopsis sp. NPDC021455]|uniref:ATP-binding cassette domain-containing protein n=1 Tax=Amycolatopsis sp. NPDC021455 TaxID=3154901 RepID=UPI003401E5E3